MFFSVSKPKFTKKLLESLKTCREIHQFLPHLTLQSFLEYSFFLWESLVFFHNKTVSLISQFLYPFTESNDLYCSIRWRAKLFQQLRNKCCNFSSQLNHSSILFEVSLFAHFSSFSWRMESWCINFVENWREKYINSSGESLFFIWRYFFLFVFVNDKHGEIFF